MSKGILVIDDDQAVRKAFTLRLEGKDYQVDTAESGEKGIELFEMNRYDLIFLDLRMPGMNGVETLRVLRQMNTDIQIYIITAFRGEFLDELKKANEENIDFEVLEKPIEGDTIALVAERVLESPVGH